MDSGVMDEVNSDALHTVCSHSNIVNRNKLAHSMQ